MKGSLLGLLLLGGAWGFWDGIYADRDVGLAGGTVLAGAVLLGLTGLRRRGAGGPLEGFLGGLGGALAVLLAQATLEPVVLLGAPHLGKLPWLSRPLAAGIRLLGGSAACSGGTAFVERAGEVIPLALNADQFAPILLLRVFTGALALGWVGGLPEPRRDVLERLAIRSVLFAPVRVLLLILAAVETSDPYLFVEPMWTLLTHIPILLLPLRPGCHAADPPRGSQPALPGGIPARSGLPLLPVVLAAIGGACAAWALGFADPGRRGEGRVLVDESHGRWEGTGIPFDETDYSLASLYNYRCWKDWLSLHYELDVTREFPTPDRLSRFDVLLIKTPGDPYSAREVEAIRAFVKSGGGLLLIGDHTNLFGMGSVLNGVARPFGLEFVYDDTYPLRHGVSDVYRPPLWTRHPVVSQLERYPFETSCSLRVPLLSEHVMIGLRLGQDMVDYSHRNFFGNIRLDLDEDYGAFLQAAAVHFGRGRVLAFTDSTNFSNFSFFWPGRRDLALSLVEYLNRKNSPWGWIRLLAALGGAGLLWHAGRRLGPRPRPAALSACLSACLAGLCGGSLAVSSWAAAAFSPPPPRRDPALIAFDRTWSGARFEEDSAVLALEGSPGGDVTDFNSFFVNTARFGLTPFFSENPEDAVRRSRYLVILNPLRTFSSEDRRLLGRFLRNGGHLLLMDSGRNTRSTANGLLGEFDLEIRRLPNPPPEAGAGTPPPSGEGASGIPRLFVKARRGNPERVSWEDLEVVKAGIGHGRLLVAIDSAVFSDRDMGVVYKKPEGKEWKGHRLQARVLNLLQGTGGPPVPAPEVGREAPR